MKQVTKSELQHTKNFADINGNDVDWHALRDEIPDEYKEDFNDDIIFELVRPWPLRRGHKYDFRDIFNGQGGTMDYRFLKESIQNYEFFKKECNSYVKYWEENPNSLLLRIYGIYEVTYANIASGILYFMIYFFILYIKITYK